MKGISPIKTSFMQSTNYCSTSSKVKSINVKPNNSQPFGMAKIVSSKQYFQNTLSYDKLYDINQYYRYNNNNKAAPFTDIDFNKEGLVEICQYLGDCAELDYGNTKGVYLLNFINKVEKIEDADKKESVLSYIVHASDIKGRTFASSAERGGLLEIKALSKLIDLLQDKPQLLYDMLGEKSKSYSSSNNPVTPGKILNEQYEKMNPSSAGCTYYDPQISDLIESCLKKVNKSIYNLATKEESISALKSKELLKQNSPMLDHINKLVFRNV